MKLYTGLIAQSSMWEQLLAQEGVPGGYVDCERAAQECSVLVVNRALRASEQRSVEAYLAAGGAVLGFAEYLTGVCGTTVRNEVVAYVVSDGHPPFWDIHLLDLGIKAGIPREANVLRTQDNVYAAYAGELGGGHAVLLPFEPAAMIRDIRAANKNFYAVRERLPFEQVSLVGKGEIRHLVHAALRYLHHARGVPYVHTWYFPDGRKNISAFRVDTDGGSKQEVDRLNHIALEHDIFMTWFIDVKSHEDWLQHFLFFPGQEMGVHCYEHLAFNTFEQNLRNMTKAKHKLHLAGISAQGFAAPFGIWNTGLAKAIDKAVFEYSSEFSFLYDSFPLYPSDGAETFLTPQVPVHPVCIGNLRRAGYTGDQMKHYFQRVIDEKILRDEPLFFYHHPTHHYWDVVKFIFRYLEQQNIGNMTLLEFIRWWGTRLKQQLTLEVEGSELRCTGTKPWSDSVWVRMIMPDNREALLPPAERIDLADVAWTGPRKHLPPPEDIRRIREFDPRRALGEVFSKITRRFSERNPPV